MARTEGRPVPRKAGGEGKKGKKFIEDKSALLSLIDGMPKWTAGRPQANKEDLAADDHMASTNDDARGVISFETVDKKKNKKTNKKGNKNSNGGGKKKVPAHGVADTNEGVLIKSGKGKERQVDGGEQTVIGGETMAEPKKKVVDRLSDKKRELASAKAAIVQKERERKRQNKAQREGKPLIGGDVKDGKKSVGFAM